MARTSLRLTKLCRLFATIGADPAAAGVSFPAYAKPSGKWHFDPDCQHVKTAPLVSVTAAQIAAVPSRVGECCAGTLGLLASSALPGYGTVRRVLDELPLRVQVDVDELSAPLYLTFVGNQLAAVDHCTSLLADLRADYPSVHARAAQARDHLTGPLARFDTGTLHALWSITGNVDVFDGACSARSGPLAADVFDADGPSQWHRWRSAVVGDWVRERVDGSYDRERFVTDRADRDAPAPAGRTVHRPPISVPAGTDARTRVEVTGRLLTAVCSTLDELASSAGTDERLVLVEARAFRTGTNTVPSRPSRWGIARSVIARSARTGTVRSDDELWLHAVVPGPVAVWLAEQTSSLACTVADADTDLDPGVLGPLLAGHDPADAVALAARLAV